MTSKPMLVFGTAHNLSHTSYLAGERRVLRLKGTLSAIGHQHGLALGGAIRELERSFLTFLADLYSGGVQGRMHTLGTHLMLRLLARAMLVRYWPQAYREEARGIGAGMQGVRCQVW